MTWKPFETAPKTGEWIFVAFRSPFSRIASMRWLAPSPYDAEPYEPFWQELHDFRPDMSYATHWMAQPALPYAWMQ